MTAEAIKLSCPIVHVRRDVDAEPIVIQTANPDLIRWDETRAKHKWPKYDEAPFLWLTFISWAAARRQNIVPADVTWELWKTTTVEVRADDPDDDDETGSPTPPGLEPG